MTLSDVPHIPVLRDEVLSLLRAAELPAGRFIDGTLGAGGHAAALLAAAPDAQLLGFDRDPHALALAAERLAPFAPRATLVHASYEQMAAVTREWLSGLESSAGPGSNPGAGVDGILLDLGVSSMQIDDPARGFAFMAEGPLDMRFDPSAPTPTAADLVNTLPADELADILFQYGEERHSRPIARAIIAARPLITTRQLADVVARAQRGPHQKIHPATRTFQALRIAVNDELGAVERVLPAAISLLAPGGRLAVISFHSLEDRLVKHTFRTEATDCLCPPSQPVCSCGHEARVRLITRKPVTAGPDEIARNVRSRSARLRVVERLAGGGSTADGP